jgi:hypothetical protein
MSVDDDDRVRIPHHNSSNAAAKRAVWLPRLWQRRYEGAIFAAAMLDYLLLASKICYLPLQRGHH